MNADLPYIRQLEILGGDEKGNLLIPSEISGFAIDAVIRFVGDSDDMIPFARRLYKKCFDIEYSAAVAHFGSTDLEEGFYKHLDDNLWSTFAYKIFEHNQNINEAVGMLLLLSDSYLEEINKPNPDLKVVTTLLVRIKDVETAILCITDMPPHIGAGSFLQATIDKARKAGQVKSWHKDPLQEVINQLDLGLSWGLIFNRLAAMGSDVPHPEFKSIDYVDGKLKLVPTDDAHNPRMVSERALKNYKKPTGILNRVE